MNIGNQLLNRYSVHEVLNQSDNINWVLLCNHTHHFQGNENVTIFGELLTKSFVSSINLSIPVKDIYTFLIFLCQAKYRITKVHQHENNRAIEILKRTRILLAEYCFTCKGPQCILQKCGVTFGTIQFKLPLFINGTTGNSISKHIKQIRSTLWHKIPLSVALFVSHSVQFVYLYANR